MKLTNHLDFAQLEVRNAVVQNLATAPSTPKVGQVYYNTATNAAYLWNGSAWQPMDATLLVGVIPNSALATNPLARANHTGTQTAASISDFATAVKAISLDQMTAPAASVSFNSKTLTNVGDPFNPQDGANKNYVDITVQSAAAGIDSKPSVRVVATANIALTGTQTIDGVTLSVGDRVLAAAQTTGAQNGVYVVASGAWSRAVDADQTGEITPGAFWFIEEGTAYGKTQWRCNNTGVLTLGTTAITIVQFGAANLYSAGNGLALAGSVFSAQLQASSGLVASGAGLAVDTNMVVRKYAATVGDGASTSIVVTHNLGTQDVQVWCRDVTTQAALLVDWVATNATSITATFAVAPALNSVRVVVQA